MAHSTGVDFFKYQATGNHFLILPPTVKKNSFPLGKKRIRELLHPAVGIGGDGLLILSQLNRRQKSATLVIFNHDGSRAKMCGNGLRCIGQFLRDEYQGDCWTLHTDSGPRVVSTTPSGLVETNLGSPRLIASLTLSSPFPHRSGRRPREFFFLDIGNLHGVTYVDTVKDFPLEEGYQWLLKQRGVPPTINFSILERTARGILKMRVRERGVGETLACGSGAAVAGFLEMQKSGGRTLRIQLPGGKVAITLREGEIYLRGAARRVFTGHFE